MSLYYVLLPIKPGVYKRYNQEEILYVKADGCYSEVIFKNENNLLLTSRLKEVEALLSSRLFFRISKSILINRWSVKEITKENIILEENIILPLVKGKKKELVKVISSSFASLN